MILKILFTDRNSVYFANIFIEEKVKFGERPFDDVHVLSGTLKLYFRELPEPLIPFDSYDDFVNAISK